MVNLAHASRKRRLFEEPAAASTATRSRDNGTRWKKVMTEKPLDLKVLDGKLPSYKSNTPVGSGTYGDCFLASYKGIDVVVKQIKSLGEDSEKAKRDVIREGKVIAALGDHEGLPLLFGVVIKDKPYGLVFKFHEVDRESLTLSNGARTKLLSERQCLNVFVNVCSAVDHIHSKGYLHNDLKGNNIILEKRENSDFFPIVIDFGKSRQKDDAEMRQRKKTTGNNYIAPEVLDGKKQTMASDVFFGSSIQSCSG